MAKKTNTAKRSSRIRRLRQIHSRSTSPQPEERSPSPQLDGRSLSPSIAERVRARAIARRQVLDEHRAARHEMFRAYREHRLAAIARRDARNLQLRREIDGIDNIVADPDSPQDIIFLVRTPTPTPIASGSGTYNHNMATIVRPLTPPPIASGSGTNNHDEIDDVPTTVASAAVNEEEGGSDSDDRDETEVELLLNVE